MHHSDHRIKTAQPVKIELRNKIGDSFLPGRSAERIQTVRGLDYTPAMKLVYQWLKTNTIEFKEFKTLVDAIYQESILKE